MAINQGGTLTPPAGKRDYVQDPAAAAPVSINERSKTCQVS